MDGLGGLGARAGGVKVTIDRVAEVEAAIRGLAAKRVMVGIPSDDEKNARFAADAIKTAVGAVSDTGKPSTITNAELGYIHEFGAPEANIPARPFLIPGVTGVKDEMIRRLRQAGEYALSGKLVPADKALNAAGLSAQNAVRNKIQTGPFAPLKPATIAARRRRSGGSAYRRRAVSAADVTPLIDTGQLRNAITYVIRIIKGK